MIQEHSQRYEPWGGVCGDPIEREHTPAKAVIRLVRYELGFAGRVTHIEPTKVTLRTTIMGRYDVTTFSGTEQEMEPLMLALSAWYQVRHVTGSGQAKRFADKMVKAGINRPIHVAMMATLSQMGNVLPVLCAVAGLDVEQTRLLKETTDKLADEQEKLQPKRGPYRRLRSSIITDLVDPIIELVIDGTPFEEALEAAA